MHKNMFFFRGLYSRQDENEYNKNNKRKRRRRLPQCVQDITINFDQFTGILLHTESSRK